MLNFTVAIWSHKSSLHNILNNIVAMKYYSKDHAVITTVSDNFYSKYNQIKNIDSDSIQIGKI